MITLLIKLLKKLIPILIHDKDDLEVPVKAAAYLRSFKNGKLLLTEGLGHRKILGDSEVIQRTVQFVALTNQQKLYTMKYPLEKSATQWKEELGEEKYRVLREKNGASTQNFTL
jgi:hypothetical protein